MYLRSKAFKSFFGNSEQANGLLCQPTNQQKQNEQ